MLMTQSLKTTSRLLIVATFAILFINLGVKDLWTQEWRWADIVWHMQTSGDYWHPQLEGMPYYDKPLLSYWLIIAVSWFTGQLSEWSLRLPSVCAGLITLLTTYALAKRIFDRQIASLAWAILLTSYFFIFWSRIASADMLNVAGVMLATYWYYRSKHNLTFINYSIFFLICAITALLKGLIGFVLPSMIVFVDSVAHKNFRQHVNLKLLSALCLATGFYLVPFIVSSLTNQGYQENGLYLAYRENFLRYVSPFDHQDPWYSYFIFLPIYLFPWSLGLIYFLQKLPKFLPQFNREQKAFLLSIAVLFLFFTVSGSRRSYYILPLVPLTAILLARVLQPFWQTKPKTLAGIFAGIYLCLATWFCYVEPAYYRSAGLKPWALQLRTMANAKAGWANWHVLALGTDSRTVFYLRPQAYPQSYRVMPADLAAVLNKQAQPSIVLMDNKAYNTAPAWLKAYPYLRQVPGQFSGLKTNNPAQIAIFIEKLAGKPNNQVK